MFVKVRFHGILKKLCPKVYEIDAQTPAEAMRGLTNQLPQLRRKDGKKYECQIKECPTKESLFSTFGDVSELNVYPSFTASGGGSFGEWVKVVVGIVLIVVGIIGLTLLGWTGWGAAGGWALISMGAALLGSGAVNLLTPVPQIPNTQESQVAESRIFNSNQNTTAIGTRIAVAYGRNKIYGQLLSFNTQAVDRGSGWTPNALDDIFYPGRR